MQQLCVLRQRVLCLKCWDKGTEREAERALLLHGGACVAWGLEAAASSWCVSVLLGLSLVAAAAETKRERPPGRLRGEAEEGSMCVERETQQRCQMRMRAVVCFQPMSGTVCLLVPCVAELMRSEPHKEAFPVVCVRKKVIWSQT